MHEEAKIIENIPLSPYLPPGQVNLERDNGWQIYRLECVPSGQEFDSLFRRAELFCDQGPRYVEISMDVMGS
jgi:hypothetical protein